MNDKVIEKIREKREFSQLPEEDIKLAYSHFSKRQISEEEKIILTKELLRKVFSAFMSRKLLSLKDKEPEWILRKHISTRERLPYYKEIYKRVFAKSKAASVIDLGAGINGFSYNFFKELNVNIDYIAIESIGQLVELMNFYFKNVNIKGKAIHQSLFEIEKIKKIIRRKKRPRIIFLFKVIDSLEMLKKDYSKELILKISKIVDKIIVSFATKSLGKRKTFFAKRNWIINFIKDNFRILDDFEFGGEKYIIFRR